MSTELTKGRGGHSASTELTKVRGGHSVSTELTKVRGGHSASTELTKVRGGQSASTELTRVRGGHSASAELTRVRGGQSASTEQDKGREHSRDRNPKGRDKIRARRLEETGRGEVLSRINGKIRSKDGPGKSWRDMAENKDPRQKGTEETTGRRIRRKKRLEQVDTFARYFAKKKRRSKASLLSGLICRFRISVQHISLYPVSNFGQIVNK